MLGRDLRSGLNLSNANLEESPAQCNKIRVVLDVAKSMKKTVVTGLKVLGSEV